MEGIDDYCPVEEILLLIALPVNGKGENCGLLSLADMCGIVL